MYLIFYFKEKRVLFFSDLNMSPYCSPSSDSSQSRYDLFGVINHRGSAWFGHYTSYARLLAYNDSAKTEIGKERK
jgi:ubiquitin C-terminal hydrolase